MAIIDTKEIPQVLKTAITVGVTPIFRGAPGVGKSDVTAEAANDMNLLLIDMRLSQCDPTDLHGLPFFEDGIAKYIPFDTFPLLGRDTLVYKNRSVNNLAQKLIRLHNASEIETVLPGLELAPDDLTKLQKLMDSGEFGSDHIHVLLKARKFSEEDLKHYDGWLLFLDELPNAPIEVQQAAYKLILDRKVSSYQLHPKCFIASAGNREEDGCFIQEMPKALKTRLLHLDTRILLDDWVHWALAHGVSTCITGYLQYRKDDFIKTKEDSNVATYPCPRTWKFASDLFTQVIGNTPVNELHKDTNKQSMIRKLVCGVVGDPVGTTFMDYIRFYESLPPLADIVANPDTHKVDYDLGIKFAIMGMLSDAVNESNCSEITTYLSRLPKEMQVMYIRSLLGRKSDLLSNAKVSEMMTQVSKSIYG